VSTDPTQQASAITGAEDLSTGQPSEEELRAAYEAEISRVTSTDMILQSVVSLLNVGGHRLGLSAPEAQGPAGGEGSSQSTSPRDLEQVRDAIDGVRALMPILERREPENVRPLRDALSQLQMAYAREASGAAGAGAGAGAAPAEGAPGSPGAPGGDQPGAERAATGSQPQAPAAGEKPAGPGPAQSSGRLWVPGQ
jgi:hypothetical protein